MSLPNLSGESLGHYEVHDRLGEGGEAVVYRATDRPSERQVALKVLDPGLTRRDGFIARLVEETATVAALGHPRIVPVYEVATRGGITYLSMRLVRSGTLRGLMAHRPMDLYSARRVLHDLAGAVHTAHEAGVVHRDLKPSNVLVDPNGAAHVVDFGLAPTRYGYAVGTPGYMAPEQAMGMPSDFRTDVHGLGAVLFEMVTGAPPYRAETVPELIVATVRAPVPAAGDGRPDLPPALVRVLHQALAKDPDERPQTVAELLDLLAAVPWGMPAQGQADEQLAALLEASPDPAFTTDRDGLVLHWNGPAEHTFGWPPAEIVGAPLLQRLIAPRHREMFERVLATVAASPPHVADGRPVDVAALRRDGTVMELEASLSPLDLGAGAGGVVGFCRDVSRRGAGRAGERHQGAGSGAAAAVPPEQPLTRELEGVCAELRLAAAAVWLPTDHASRLRCEAFWHAPRLDAADLWMLSQGVQRIEHVPLVGRALTRREPEWRTDLERTARSRRDRAAVTAGVRSCGALPICAEDGKVLGTLECFEPSPGPPTAERQAALEGACRRLAPILRDARAEHDLGRTRFELDQPSTVLGFSCAFMKFMTVHGAFGHFSGWVELVGEDPTTARAECVIKAASVETGSVDRDYHLSSADFFAVERFPDILFRSTRVGPLGDQRFRVAGELTIRDVTRPVRLDVRLEDTATESPESGAVDRMTLTASGVISRLDWFLDWERALQAGRWIVGDQVRLDLVITLVRRPNVPPPAG